MSLHQVFLKELCNLETILKKFKYWGPEKPEFSLTEITTPFGVGTISLHQWFQYLYIPGMRLLAETDTPLPLSQIFPYAEEVLMGEGAKEILMVINKLDAITEGTAID